jgi:hypothetical protein
MPRGTGDQRSRALLLLSQSVCEVHSNFAMLRGEEEADVVSLKTLAVNEHSESDYANMVGMIDQTPSRFIGCVEDDVFYGCGRLHNVFHDAAVDMRLQHSERLAVCTHGNLRAE